MLIIATSNSTRWRAPRFSNMCSTCCQRVIALKVSTENTKTFLSNRSGRYPCHIERLSLIPRQWWETDLVSDRCSVVSPSSQQISPTFKERFWWRAQGRFLMEYSTFLSILFFRAGTAKISLESYQFNLIKSSRKLREENEWWSPSIQCP